MNTPTQPARRLPRWLSLRSIFRAGLVSAAASRGRPAPIALDPRARGLERRGALAWK